MKDLYKLAVAFEKASQVPSLQQIRDISEKGPFGGAIPSHAPAAPAFAAINPSIQASLNSLGCQPQIKVDGLLGDETKNALDWFKRTYGLTPTTSPDLVYREIGKEAAKLGGKPNQVAFKVPAQEPARPGMPLGPVGDHHIPGNISADPTPQKNTGDLINDIQNKR